MKSSPSAYYPPRARWHPRWRLPLYRFKYRINESRYRLLGEPMLRVSWLLVMSLLIPGYAFWARARWLGKAIMAGYGLLLFLFLVALGTPLANAAFGLMIALHATSICYALEQTADDWTLLKRVGLALIVLCFMGLAVYRPLLRQMQARLFMPLLVHDRVYVVKTFVKPDMVRPGTRVAYKIPASSLSLPGAHGSIFVYNGMGIGNVLAEGGDHIKFTSEGMLVNGSMLPRSAFMPTPTALIVPEKHWFIWPEFDIKNRPANVSDQSLSELYFRRAMVSQDQFVGTVCKRWFWRRMD